MIDFKAIDRAYFHTYSNPSLIGKLGSWLDQSEYSPLLGSQGMKTIPPPLCCSLVYRSCAVINSQQRSVYHVRSCAPLCAPLVHHFQSMCTMCTTSGAHTRWKIYVGMVCVCVCVCVCVSARARTRARVYVCVCVSTLINTLKDTSLAEV